MKTKSFNSIMHYRAYLIICFFLVSLSTFAQCPTIDDGTPPPICNASGFTFNDLNAFATDMGNGIAWFDSPTGGNLFSGTELVSEGIYYADDNSGNCGSRNSITIRFVLPPTNQNLQGFFCSDENPTIQSYIDLELQPNAPPGGMVEVYYDRALTSLASPSDAIPETPTNFYIIFISSSSPMVCRSQIENGVATQFQTPPNPSPMSVQQFCADTNPTVGNLDAGTTDPFLWYDDVDTMGNPIPPALSSNEPLINGNTYHVKANSGICRSETVPVVVNITNPANAGNSASLPFCNNNLPSATFDLFDELIGTPDNTGTWVGPITTTNGFRGTVNVSSLTVVGMYTFTYTIESSGACPEDTSTVTIEVFAPLSSGVPSASNPDSYCESNLPTNLDLFSLIENEDPDGQWTQGATSTDLVVSSPFNFSGFAPGTYNFTYTQNILPNACIEESTTVQVIILADPNAGVAINQTFCENNLVANSPFNLFDALDGSQDDNSGIWTDVSNDTISNFIDISNFTVEQSPFVFTYTINNGTCSDSEDISISIENAPESGTPIAMFPEFCEGMAPENLNLFDLLEGEDQTGQWFIGTDTSGTITNNIVDISSEGSGTLNYTYDVDAIDSCDDALVTVSIIINPLPDTGIPSSASFCENDVVANSPLDLFEQLTGEDSGGTWTDDNTSGALTGSAVDLTELTIGAFNFTYTITDANNCTNSSTVIITIEDAPESGVANPPVAFCIADIISAQTYNLFDSLEGEDQVGIWNDDDASGALSGSLVTIDGLTAGTYNFTYNVDAIGSCDDVDVTVSIVINDTPAPTADVLQEYCDSATVADLVATGTTIQWYDTATGGAPLDATTALIDGENYYATQTDANTNCESSIRTQVDVTIYQSPNAGAINTTPIVACNDNTSVDLFDGLDGTEDSGGTWNDDDTTGALTGNILDATGLTTGTYNFTYTVTASAPCVDDSTTIVITIEAPQSTGSDTTLDICSDGITTDLFTLLGTADTGGSWSPALTSGTGNFDPSTDASGTYTYTITNACGTVSSNVVVTVVEAPNAGVDATLAACAIDATTDLFTLLGINAQTGGTWSPTLNSGTGVFDPSVDTAGTYTYIVTANAPCTTDARAEVTITIDDSPPVIVLEPSPTFCMVDNPTVADLSNSIRATGTVNWYQDAALTIPLVDTDGLVDGEDYYATQTNNTGCESSVAEQVTVTINNAATPTLKDASETYCINDGPTLSTLSDNIIEYESNLNNIVWYDVAIGGAPLAEDTALNVATYYAALIDQTTNCESSVRLEVTPDVTACGKLKLPDGFSPNGDRVNDTYSIDNIVILYPNFEIEIFNRNGNIVYKGNASTPQFDGTSNQARVLAKGDLPVGVYFYIFRFNNGVDAPEQGRLYLSR